MTTGDVYAKSVCGNLSGGSDLCAIPSISQR